MYQQLKDLLLPQLEPHMIPEIMYVRYLPNNADSNKYYFDENMNEIGYITLLNPTIDCSTTGREWAKETIKEYITRKVWWRSD